MWNFLELAALSLAVAAGIACYFLWNYYAATRPSIPQPSVRRLYPLTTHGTVVYLTHTEDVQLTMLMWISGVSSFLGVIIDLAVKPLRKA